MLACARALFRAIVDHRHGVRLFRTEKGFSAHLFAGAVELGHALLVLRGKRVEALFRWVDLEGSRVGGLVVLYGKAYLCVALRVSRTWSLVFVS